MKSNLGKIDRILRAAIGLCAIIMGMLYNSWLIVIGGIIFMTSVFSWCPIYAPFGWSTHKKAINANGPEGL